MQREGLFNGKDMEECQMGTTRQALQPHFRIDSLGDQLVLHCFYNDGREEVRWRFAFTEPAELTDALAFSIAREGLPKCVAVWGFQIAAEFKGAYLYESDLENCAPNLDVGGGGPNGYRRGEGSPPAPRFDLGQFLGTCLIFGSVVFTCWALGHAVMFVRGLL